MESQVEFSFNPVLKERWLMLSEPDQPEGPYTIERIEDHNTYVVFVLVDQKGFRFKSAIFPRDVQKCVDEWGTKPSQWQWIKLSKKPGSSRYYFEPLNHFEEMKI
jgi:hypothetical protein